jgi:hypothetical protein
MKKFDTKGNPYDMKSIMHYHGRSFGKKGKDGQQMITIKIKGVRVFWLILNQMLAYLDQ